MKSELNELKVHPRETYNDLIKRLVENFSDAEKESLVETLEVMSDPDLMRSIAKGVEDINEGRTKSLEQIKKEMGLD